MVCAICTEDAETELCALIPCGHIFHKECIAPWEKSKWEEYQKYEDPGCRFTCPVCKTVLKWKNNKSTLRVDWDALTDYANKALENTSKANGVVNCNVDQPSLSSSHHANSNNEQCLIDPAITRDKLMTMERDSLVLEQDGKEGGAFSKLETGIQEDKCIARPQPNTNSLLAEQDPLSSHIQSTMVVFHDDRLSSSEIRDFVTHYQRQAKSMHKIMDLKHQNVGLQKKICLREYPAVTRQLDESIVEVSDNILYLKEEIETLDARRALLSNKFEQRNQQLQQLREMRTRTKTAHNTRKAKLEYEKAQLLQSIRFRDRELKRQRGNIEKYERYEKHPRRSKSRP